MAAEAGQSRPVAVVTDSTADLPSSLAATPNITVVPLSVRFGERAYLDQVELGPDEFLTQLRAATTLPTTSQPPVTAFEAAFRTALDAGCDILCITLASALSGTHNAARLAAEAVGADRVRVVDSGTVTMRLGWAALAAARAAMGGADLAGAEAAARAALERAHLYCVLDTLDYVYRGGRIGRASQLVGSVLSIKPILTVRDGEVIPVERVRTWRKALDRMVELARSHAPLAELAVLHVGNPADARTLADRLDELVPDGAVLVTEAGPVIATYAGPGAVGVVPLVAG